MAPWPLEWAAFVCLQSAVGAVKIHLGPYTTWTENTIRKAKGGKKKGERGSKKRRGGVACYSGVSPAAWKAQEAVPHWRRPLEHKKEQGLIVISGQTARAPWLSGELLAATASPSPFPPDPAGPRAARGWELAVLPCPPRSAEAPSSSSLWLLTCTAFSKAQPNAGGVLQDARLWVWNQPFACFKGL